MPEAHAPGFVVLKPLLMAKNSRVYSNNKTIPRAEPVAICTLALIIRVSSSSNSMTLRASTLAILNGQNGFKSTTSILLAPCERNCQEQVA